MGEEKKYIITDLDGTLSDQEHRHNKFLTLEPKDWNNYFLHCVFDPPIWPMIHVWNALWEYLPHRQFEFIIASGRSETVKWETQLWLRDHNINYHQLWMRPAKDFRPDNELKAEWLLQLSGEVFLVFEDRARVVSMYRELGIPTFQVSDGNF